MWENNSVMKEFFGKIFKDKLIYFLLGYFLLVYAFPHIPIDKCVKNFPNYANIFLISSIIISTILNIFVQFGIVFELVKRKFSPKILGFILLGVIICLILSIIWIEHYLILTHPKVFPPKSTYWIHLLAIGKNIGSGFISSLPQRGIIDLLIIVLCFSFGSLLSYIVKEKNLLVPVMICCGFIDIITCTMGFVGKVMSKAPEVVSGVSTGISMIGGSKFLKTIATIGPGDFIFVALVFAVAFRFNFNTLKTFWTLFGFLCVGMLLVVLHILPFLPALVCVATATLLANYKEFKFSKDEKISTFIVLILLVLVVLGIIFIHK